MDKKSHKFTNNPKRQENRKYTKDNQLSTSSSADNSTLSTSSSMDKSTLLPYLL